jgi:hypothetical protein
MTDVNSFFCSFSPPDQAGEESQRQDLNPDYSDRLLGPRSDRRPIFALPDRAQAKMSMRIDKQVEAMEARKSGGRFFRLMLGEVNPEHVPDMIHMLWLFGHGGKELLVPKVGRWLMKMPHGYTLVGEGRAGVKIEPPRGQVALQADNPYGGDQFEQSRPALSGPKLDAHDMEGVLAL